MLIVLAGLESLTFSAFKMADESYSKVLVKRSAPLLQGVFLVYCRAIHAPDLTGTLVMA